MQNIMQKLREAKEAKHLSYQDIVDITEKNGEAVSISTIKRMFAKDSDITDFRYNQTIRPVVRAVLGLDDITEEPNADPQQPEEYYTTIEAMKAVIDFKHQQLTSLTEENERLRAENQSIVDHFQKEIRTIRDEAQRKIDHLKDQIAYLRGVNDRNSKIIDKLMDK